MQYLLTQTIADGVPFTSFFQHKNICIYKHTSKQIPYQFEVSNHPLISSCKVGSVTTLYSEDFIMFITQNNVLWPDMILILILTLSYTNPYSYCTTELDPKPSPSLNHSHHRYPSLDPIYNLILSVSLATEFSC